MRWPIETTHESATPSSAASPLTPKEKTVLEFLEGYVRENGYAPTYQEICSHFGFASFNSAQRYLKQLEAKQYVSLAGGNQKRAITLLQAASAYQEQTEHRANVTPLNVRATAKANAPVEIDSAYSPGNQFQVPLLGRVAAGLPLEAYEHDEFIDIPASLVKSPERTYALRVQGQSMIDDGILDGDVILVQRQNRAENGEIVVAVVAGDRGTEEATVKRFYRRSTANKSSKRESDEALEKEIELRPANSTMSSFWYNAGEVQIRGVVVGLIRRFW